MSAQTFKADSMFQALQQIQNDLGPDAVVLSARELPSGPLWEKWKRSSVEVVAIPAHEFPGKLPNQPAQAPGILPDDDSKIEWITADQTGQPDSGTKKPVWAPQVIRKETLTVPRRAAATEVETQPVDSQTLNPAAASCAAAAPSVAAAPERELPKGLRTNMQVLSAQGVDELFLERVAKNLASSIGAAKLQDAEVSRKYLGQALQAELRDLSGLALRPPARIISLVGPSGSGKTGMAAKLAFYYGQQGKKVVWVCADTVRTGAISEAKLFTETLGIALELVYTPGQLKALIDNLGDADLILVDTPGYNPLDESQMSELGSFLTELPVHYNLLVVPASMKELDLIRMASALGLFGLNGLVVTKMDETASYGSVYNLARKSRIPLAYFSYGKTAVGHLQLAGAQNLVDAMFKNGEYR